MFDINMATALRMQYIIFYIIWQFKLIVVKIGFKNIGNIFFE